jgi:hypothetical protein
MRSSLATLLIVLFGVLSFACFLLREGFFWIPAFAGMTGKRCTGMTGKRCTGMTAG